MMEKLANVLTVLAVAGMLLLALSVNDFPDVQLKDLLLRRSELPENDFRFRWVGEEPTAQEEPEPTEPTSAPKKETPFLSFSDLTEELDAVPMQTIPDSGINQLPADVLSGD